MAEKGDGSVSTSRKNFLVAAFAGGVTVLSSSNAPAMAKEVSATQLRDNYLSTCVYECTKPKGAEQKGRAECIDECKLKYKAEKKAKAAAAAQSEAGEVPKPQTE